MKYGFIGAGNMVSAIVKGMTADTGGFEGKDILITSKTQVTAQKLARECGANAASLKEIVQTADVILLGVKPNVLEEVLPEINQAFKEILRVTKPFFISIAAGKTLEYIGGFFEKDFGIVRVMPNINAKIGASTSGICWNEFVSEEQKEISRRIFSSIGSVWEIPEKQFGIFSVIGGASVAFAYLYMDSLARAALKAGMPKKLALAITAQTVEGSARMIAQGKEDPWTLIDQVCSPGGTTIEGICTLEENGFETGLIRAFDAVLKKDSKM